MKAVLQRVSEASVTVQTELGTTSRVLTIAPGDFDVQRIGGQFCHDIAGHCAVRCARNQRHRQCVTFYICRTARNDQSAKDSQKPFFTHDISPPFDDVPTRF